MISRVCFCFRLSRVSYSLYCNKLSVHNNNHIKLTHYDVKKKRAHDSQIVRAKEALKLSYGGPSERQASATNQRVNALHQGHLAIKEDTIAIISDWVYNQTCRLSHDIHAVSNSFVTFNNRFPKYITNLITSTGLYFVHECIFLCVFFRHRENIHRNKAVVPVQPDQ